MVVVYRRLEIIIDQACNNIKYELKIFCMKASFEKIISGIFVTITQKSSVKNNGIFCEVMPILILK